MDATFYIGDASPSVHIDGLMGTIQTSVGAVGKIADEIPIPFYCIALTDFPFEIYKNSYSSAFVILIIVPSQFCSR